MQVAKTNLEIGHHVEYCELLVRQTRTQMFPAEKILFQFTLKLMEEHHNPNKSILLVS